MKKVFNAIPGVLAVIYYIIPLLYFIAVVTGRYLEFYSPVFMAVLISLQSVAAAVVMLVFKVEYNGANGAVLSIVLFLSAVTQFYFVRHAITVYGEYNTLTSAIIMLFGTASVIVMFVKCVDDSVFKAIVGVVTVIFTMLAVGLSIYFIISASLFGEDKISDGPLSPNGAYAVEITHRDSGLTTEGGTYVNVRRTDESRAPFGVFKYKPERIYSGGRLEYERMTIDWLDDETLVINGRPYSLNVENAEQEEG